MDLRTLRLLHSTQYFLKLYRTNDSSERVSKQQSPGLPCYGKPAAPGLVAGTLNARTAWNGHLHA